jgi:hypothetical protein
VEGAVMRKEFRSNEFITIAFETFDFPQGAVVALSFYSNKGDMPGFNMCFPADAWRDFQREVADYGPG